MKAKICSVILLLTATAATAQTNNLTSLLQQGLFEEQANRNLDAAIADYQTLATKFDKDRQVAATAIFRLGECYRAQGKTTEATAQYQRIVRDFSDQTTLVTLSQQDLAGMGVNTAKTEPAVAAPNSDAELLKRLQALNEDELERVLPTLMPNNTLDSLIKQRDEAAVQRAKLLVDYPESNVQVVRLDMEVKGLKQEIDTTISGMMQALKMRAELSGGPAAPKRVDLLADLSVPVSSEEDQEIARIQRMSQDSPDLINTPDSYGKTPLQAAAAAGYLKVVNYLLDHGAAINAGSFPALSRAAEAGNRAMVELLLSRGAQVDNAEANGMTALHFAALHGYLSVVEALLAAKPEVNARDSNHRTPLTLAVENRAVFVAQTLLAHGADPNNSSDSTPNGSMTRKEDGTPLHIAVALRDAAMVALLLTNHPDFTLRNRWSESALDIAAIQNDTGIARQLIDAGADVNAAGTESQGKYTPLHRAASAGSREIAGLLLERGANPNVRDRNGSTPLISAMYANDGEAGRAIISTLLQHKADPNLANSDGNTPLIVAIGRRNVPVAKDLLAGGANPNVRRGDGYPALVLAVADAGDQDLVAALINAKADVNAAGPEGKAPLHFAAEKDRPDLVGLLVKAGADVNARARNGMTPLNYTRASNPSRNQGLMLGGVPGQPMSLQVQNSPDGSEATNTLTVADILHQNGALDDLPDFTRIRITRQGLASPVEVFRKGPRLTNQYTLLETVMRFYNRSQTINGQSTWLAVPFPDFGRLTIHRPGPKIGSKEQEIKVDLLNRSNIVDCAQDVPVQFGDVIEIPESVHALNADVPNPVGEMEGTSSTFAERMHAILATQGGSVPGENPYRPAAACLQKSVQLVVGGETTTFKVDSWREGFLKQALGRLEARAALRSSSDLARVQVTRRTGKSAKPMVFTMDVTDNSQDEPLWLQEGDVIEVPDK